MSGRSAGESPDSTSRRSRNWFLGGGDEYARARPDYPPEIVDYLAGQMVGPAGGSQEVRQFIALDIGCGTGQFTRQLAARFERVIGIDPSADQLAHAPARAGVRYVCGTAERLPVADGCADLLTVAQAAHWFDLDRFWSEVRRVAVDGARIVLLSYGISGVGSRQTAMSTEGSETAALSDLFDHFARIELEGFWPPERRLVDRGYVDIAMPFDEADVPAVPMQRWWDLDELLAYVSTWSAVRAARHAGRDDLLRAFSDGMERSWGPRGARRLVQWPLTIRVGRVGGRDESVRRPIR